MGHLTALWHTALEQQENGDLSAWSPAMIADYSDYPGRPPRLVRALLKHGWLDGDMKLHDWWQYAGPYLRSKYKRNPERWEAVRNRYVTVTQPYTEPNRTDLTKPTKPTDTEDGQLIDRKKELTEKIEELAVRKARGAKEAKLLGLRWYIKGDHLGKSIQDLPGEYCEWALGALKNIGQEYKDALAVRLDQKKSEAIR